MAVNLRSTVGASLIWLTTVAGVSATAWFAIDRAGRDLTAADVSSLSPQSVGTAPANTNPDGSPSPVDGSPGPSSSTPTTSASTTPREKSVSVAGGQVYVRCTGTTILLRIAQPENGWRVDVDSSGPREVDLSFKLGDGDESGRKSQVSAVCSSGTPVFTVEDGS